MSLQEAEEAVSTIRRQREVETAREEVEGSSQGKEGGVKKQRVGSLEKAVLEGEHRQMCEEAQRHEAMRCFRLTGTHTSYTLLHDSNINVFPGFRNFGNTCWLNSLLQCYICAWGS